MNEPHSLIAHFVQGESSLIGAVALALLGGFARVMQRPASITLIVLIGRVITSAFTGITVFLLIEPYTMDASMKAAITGIAGYAGVDLLDVLSSRLVEMGRQWRINHPKDDRNANP